LSPPAWEGETRTALFSVPLRVHSSIFLCPLLLCVSPFPIFFSNKRNVSSNEISLFNRWQEREEREGGEREKRERESFLGFLVSSTFLLLLFFFFPTFLHTRRNGKLFPPPHGRWARARLWGGREGGGGGERATRERGREEAATLFFSFLYFFLTLSLLPALFYSPRPAAPPGSL